jgi:hypothetical protein
MQSLSFTKATHYEVPSAFLAFAPRNFGAGVSFFSLWLNFTALALATASCLKSGRYPFFAVEPTTLRYSFLLGVDAEKEDCCVDFAGLFWRFESLVVMEILKHVSILR